MSKIKKIKVNLAKKSYEIIIGKRIISHFAKSLKRLNLGTTAAIISNKRIRKNIGSKIEANLNKNSFLVKFFEIPDSEMAKSAKVALGLIKTIASFDVKRRIFIVALGGGVVGDLSGYVAATYKRGIAYVQVPTTFLSQIDSSIGGKVGIDLEIGKNLVGAFHQPRLVFSDISFLSSLDLRQIRSGLAEAIKYAVIKDKNLFEFLENNYTKILKFNLDVIEEIVFKCSKIKAKIVEEDEQEEKGIRTILNFGHTIGHAIEAAANYKFYTHGEAIGLGMICSSEIAYRLGILELSSCLRIKNLISRVGLPTQIKNLKLSDILSALTHDKKFIFGKNRFVLPNAIGKVKVYPDIPLKLISFVVKSRLSS
ncbi:MAG: 3-dehydroquinate synthase [Candidatus Omnitrophota bacterium]|nr:3-dehydroquinate synthase [Candidatus Omnitrophota bacterium]